MNNLGDAIILSFANEGIARSGMLANWIYSLKRVGLPSASIRVAALDEVAYRLAKRLRVDCFRHQSTRFAAARDALVFRSDGWREMMFNKLELVGAALEQGKPVLYADLDIVFLRNPFAYLSGLEADKSIWFQSDAPKGVLDRPRYLCAGLFFAHPGQCCRDLFSADAEDLSDFESDQPLLQHRAQKLPEGAMGFLDNELFPNGCRFMENPEESLNKAFAIHFNWMPYEQKRWQMIRHGVWYVRDSWVRELWMGIRRKFSSRGISAP